MPAGSERFSGGENDELLLRLRPHGVRVATVLFGAVLVVATIVVWLALPPRAQDSFTLAQRLTVVGMLLAAGLVGHALSRCRVVASEAGLLVVNGYRTRWLSWPQVVAVRLHPGNPWAYLDLSDGTTVPVRGIQGSDGARARDQVATLRRLIEAHAAQEPPAGLL